MVKIALVIAFYEGDREYCSIDDCKKYQEIQKNALKKYRHDLTDVIFVISIDNLPKEKYETFEKIGDIIYYYRENINLSFGAWMDACRMFKKDYDYFIFSEDDYAFIQQDFDRKLLETYENEFKSEGYMSTYKDGGTVSTIGIVSTKELIRINYFYNFQIYFKGPRTDLPKHNLLGLFFKMFPWHNFATNYDCFPYWGSDKIVSIYTFDKKEKTPQELIDKTMVCCVQFLNEKYEIDLEKKHVFLCK